MLNQIAFTSYPPHRIPFRDYFMRILAVIVSLLILAWPSIAQAAATPRLVVVVSIDQFPYEYLERMRSGFRPEGIFLRMCDDGANFTNCNHGHAFTKTAPGHSVQLTGAFPNHNGIINNEWFDPAASRGEKPERMYCVDDPDVEIVGVATRDIGRSPKNLLVDTLGDVLKLNRPGTRVFGLSLKDRAAILMSGHAADGAIGWKVVNGSRAPTIARTCPLTCACSMNKMPTRSFWARHGNCFIQPITTRTTTKTTPSSRANCLAPDASSRISCRIKSASPIIRP